jgi:hypothetical protein
MALPQTNDTPSKMLADSRPNGATEAALQANCITAVLIAELEKAGWAASSVASGAQDMNFTSLRHQKKPGSTAVRGLPARKADATFGVRELENLNCE